MVRKISPFTLIALKGSVNCPQRARTDDGFESFLLVRGQIVPMSAMRVFDSLGVARDIEAIGSPLTIYGRSDKQGGALASLNFSSLRTYQDRPTLGVNYLDLERTLQSIVAKKTPFKPQCVVELIESEPVPDMKLAHVRWISNFLTSRTVEKGLYDAVIVSDGLFSMSREKHWPSAHALEGVAQIYEAVIPRPAKVMKGYASDQWCGDKRVGFFPVEGSNQDLLYVYGMTRLAEHGGPSDKSPSSSKPVEGSEVAKSDKKEPAPPKQERVPATVMLKLFGEIGGPWRDVAEAISALPSVNSTVVLSGYFTAEHPPVKGRVVAIGNSGFALPAPFLGHDLGTAVESAQYVANTIAINTAPLIYAIHGFNKEYYNMGPVLEASRTELRSALFLESRLPNFITKWMMKTTSSDKALVAQQIELLGLKMTKQDQLDAFPIKRVQQLRKEWHSMSDAERDSTKREVERNLQAFTAQMEHELAELAESRQAKSP